MDRISLARSLNLNLSCTEILKAHLFNSKYLVAVWIKTRRLACSLEVLQVGMSWANCKYWISIPKACFTDQYSSSWHFQTLDLVSIVYVTSVTLQYNCSKTAVKQLGNDRHPSSNCFHFLPLAGKTLLTDNQAMLHGAHTCYDSPKYWHRRY